MTLIEQILLDIVKNTFSEADITTLSLDTPPKKELWDFAYGVFSLAKSARLAPPVIAEKLANALSERAEYFRDASVMGGYVNFCLTSRAWGELFAMLKIKDHAKKDETIVVDYIGANAGKPLHIGHICTPSIGQAIINTHEYLGYDVISDSHFGDWGGIFGKLITLFKIFTIGTDNQKILTSSEATIYAKLSKELSEMMWYLDRERSESVIKLSEILKNKDSVDLEYLFYGYQLITIFSEENSQIDTQCRKEFQYLSWIWIDYLNDKDRAIHEKNVEFWKQFTSISIAEVQEQLNLLNIKPREQRRGGSRFYNIGESFYEGLDLPRPNNEDYPDLQWNMKDIVTELIKKNVATKNEDGSVGVVFPEETKIPSCVLQKKEGTGLYLTSDLAAIKYRLHNWKPSKIIYCVDSRQQLHLRQAFDIAHRAWDTEWLDKTELFHAFNGFIKLKEGAMSTRKGTVIFLKDLIDNGFSRTKAIIESKGQSLSDADIQAIAVGAIKYSYLAQDREKDVVFDWDKALAFEGNSGPYIQYSYVRAKNIIEKADELLCPPVKGGGVAGGFVFDYNALTLSEYDRSCLRQLSFFERAVTDSAAKYKPHILAIYCYDLASEFNSFYVHTPKILEEQDENLRAFRLALIARVRDTIQKGFELLAIPLPEKM